MATIKVKRKRVSVRASTDFVEPSTEVVLHKLAERNKRVQRTDCGAENARGTLCRKPAGSGTGHPGWGRCSMHAGNDPAGIRHAAIAEAQYLGRTWGSKVPTDATQALVDELARTNGAVQWLQLRIEEELVGVELAGEDPLTHLIGPRGQLLRKMMNEERDRLTRISTACLNLGLKERELRLAERMGTLIQRVLEATLNDLHLTPEQRDAARPILAAHLTAAAHSVVEGQIVS